MPKATSGSWKDLAHPSCDSPNISRRFALGARDVCLVGETPDVLRPPDIAAMRGSMALRLRLCMK